jgi:hypothetical protein
VKRIPCIHRILEDDVGAIVEAHIRDDDIGINILCISYKGNNGTFYNGIEDDDNDLGFIISIDDF